MPTALALSPHLDDAVFSCGGLLSQLGDAGWHVCLATAFTATIPSPTGFALACQLDKGLGPDVDYMALRRDEDRAAAAILGITDLRWLGLPEAPHRGYNSAPALFGALRADDEVWRPLAVAITALLAELQPDLVLAPQGLGNHVDHRQMIRALAENQPVTSYRDTPYAMRLATGPDPAETLVPIAAGLDRKIKASQAYASQIGFQFGGPAALAQALRDFAVREGQGVPAERFSGRVTPRP